MFFSLSITVRRCSPQLSRWVSRVDVSVLSVILSAVTSRVLGVDCQRQRPSHLVPLIAVADALDAVFDARARNLLAGVVDRDDVELGIYALARVAPSKVGLMPM